MNIRWQRKILPERNGLRLRYGSHDCRTSLRIWEKIMQILLTFMTRIYIGDAMFLY